MVTPWWIGTSSGKLVLLIKKNKKKKMPLVRSVLIAKNYQNAAYSSKSTHVGLAKIVKRLFWLINKKISKKTQHSPSQNS